MFNGPEYERYRQLCRELQLERKFEDGDWFWWPGRTFREPGVYLSMPTDSWHGGWDYTIDGWPGQAVWLPRLDQWIAMTADLLGGSEVGLDLQAQRIGALKLAGGYAPRDPNADAWTMEEYAAHLWQDIRELAQNREPDGEGDFRPPRLHIHRDPEAPRGDDPPQPDPSTSS